MAAPPLLQLLLGALLVPPAAQPPAANAGALRCTSTRAAPPVSEVRVGAVLPEDSRRYLWAVARVAPALSLALESLQPLDGISVRTAFASIEDQEPEGECQEYVIGLKAVGLRGSLDPDVLLGLGCFDSSYLLVSFSKYWGLPILRAGNYPKDGRLPDAVYAGPLGPSLAAFQLRLLQHFNWTCRAVLLTSVRSDSWRYCDFWVNDALRQELAQAYALQSHYEEPGEAIRYIEAHGRVAVICGPLEQFHQIMHLAQAQNMTNGDYVFFYLDPFGEGLRAAGHREARKPWQSKESNDTGGLREAFQTVLVITPHEPQTPEYRRFGNDLVLRTQRDSGVAINDSLGHLVAGCYHDGLLLYLRALSETLREGGTKRNTSRILEKMRSLKIQGVTGTVSINKNNTREMNFDLWSMRDVESGEFQVARHYIASEDKISWTGDILWKKGGPILHNTACVKRFLRTWLSTQPYGNCHPPPGVSPSGEMPKCFEREKEMNPKSHNKETRLICSSKAVQPLLKVSVSKGISSSEGERQIPRCRRYARVLRTPRTLGNTPGDDGSPSP